MSVTAAEGLAALLLVPRNGLKSQIAQIVHRQDVIDKWGGIPSGIKVLELGCGQGDCTVVIADSIGDNGSVDAVDPAPPGYGSPYTVEQAQQHLSTSRLGPRINWIRADPLEFLPAESSAPKYDIGILAHCLWYFSSPSVITSTLQRLGSLCKQVYVAEWSLSTPTLAALPHVLSALTQASLECRKPQSVSNVRTVLSSSAIKKLADGIGLRVVREGLVSPNEGLKDGSWEVAAVADEDFVKEVEENVKNEREQAVVFALRDAMLRSLERVESGRKGVRSMNVWCAVFEKA